VVSVSAVASARPPSPRPQLLRGFGVESEVELAFAALHQLLRPVLDRLGWLPIAQADAPRGAFGLVYVQVNRFLVELGVLGLLAEVAGEQLVLCLVDGAQRLDRASADAPVFVGRRLVAEPIVLLVAARDDDLRPFDGPGLPALRLEGLDPWGPGSCWRRRPASWPRGPGSADQPDRREPAGPAGAAGNPHGRAAGRIHPLPQRLPLSTRLQQAFLLRARALPRATRTLLLVAAAAVTGELATVRLLAGR
jgi:hypothetical protein